MGMLVVVLVISPLVVGGAVTALPTRPPLPLIYFRLGFVLYHSIAIARHV
eukprot:NODE_11719_length_251_cov_17.262376_g9949_i0.p2 GENE.NODE_11719_length_251_cov_17.262376_g9949_i0~~NODE_11719_length_251_cov_17.262376_g9949_i0.p2  ORF type:complete len:57 (+),score=17.45 NODE_11719_length_251_cov_17.262376_g9949_i0:22-171(+)